MQDRGRLVIISGPSGAGKSTLVRQLMTSCDLRLQLSVSATTRKARPGEVDSVHYHFLTCDEFERRKLAGDFLEWKEVFGRGDLYGTLREPVTTGLNAGKWVVLEIDVNGAMGVMADFPDAISIFIHPGSVEELERRLRGRRTDSEESIQRRLEVARQEMKFADKYRHQVINDSADRAISEILAILEQYRN